MSVLSVLKFVTHKQEQLADPKEQRRRKLIVKLREQIALAQSQKSGEAYTVNKLRRVKDQESGETRLVESAKRLKPWWWVAQDGKTYLSIRYGAKTLEIQKGKNAIETAGLDQVITTLQLVLTATQQGELDTQIDALRTKLREGFRRETLTLKRSGAQAQAPA